MNKNNNLSKLYKLYVLWKLYKKYKVNCCKKRRSPRWWVRPHLMPHHHNKLRLAQSEYFTVYCKTKTQDIEQYRKLLRISPNAFDNLLEKIKPLISRQDISRISITAEERLTITLRYLASGNSMTSIAVSFRVGQSTCSKIINETCSAIWEVLHSTVLPIPDKNKFNEIADGFSKRWNFPHVIGAIDGKHVAIQAPIHSGSSHYNYKGFHSTVLLAICDYRYRFVLVDIGAEGRRSDGSIFKSSVIGEGFENKTFCLPQQTPFLNYEYNMPFYLVGDAAFPLTNYLMRL